MSNKNTAVARREAAPRDAGLTDAGKRQLAEIRARNALVVAITNESWGNKLNPVQRRAVAEYMRRFRLDVSEVDVLGGRPYRNGQYYKRRIMEMASSGRLDWVRQGHIGPDERLDVLEQRGDEWARDENTRRLRERIRLAVPPDATHAYTVAVKLKSLAEPLDGCKWYVPGRTREGWSKTVQGRREQVPADPVGDENPVETVETRAWHRVGKLVAAEIPELREEEKLMDTAAVEVEAEVEEIGDAEGQRNAEARAALPPGGHTVWQAPDASDPYSLDPEPRVSARQREPGEEPEENGDDHV